MQPGILQIPPEPWPSGYGEVISLLNRSPQWFVDRYGLEFFEGSDNLDNYHAVAIQLPSGRRIGLLRHVGAPELGVEVHADVQEDVNEAVSELLRALGLPEHTITWLRDALPVPEPASAQVH